MSLINAVHVERISKPEHSPLFIGAPVNLLDIYSDALENVPGLARACKAHAHILAR